MPAIDTIHARQILDSRGNPTIEVDVLLQGGGRGRAAVPSGASTGRHEALELRDGDRLRFGGKSVSRAVENVNAVIAPALRGAEGADQTAVDARLIELDGTPTKSKLGANAILGVSMAVARASAAGAGVPLYRWLQPRDDYRLPTPMINVINGGAHAANALDFQEFMLVPHGAPTFAEAMRWSAETFHALKTLLVDAGHVTSVGDEGGFAPNIKTEDEALDLLCRAIRRAGYRQGADIAIALDPAASGMFEHGRYEFQKSGRPALTMDGMIELFASLIGRYPIISIEDGLAEDDWTGWATLTARLGSRVMLVGDDIFVTNPGIIRKGIDAHVANATLIKLNQIGTVTETLDAIKLSHQAGYRTIVSHRSGETEDSFIADFAVAAGSAYIKAGSTARSERLAKYNQLIRIEEELGASAAYGRAAAESRANAWSA